MGWVRSTVEACRLPSLPCPRRDRHDRRSTAGSRRPQGARHRCLQVPGTDRLADRRVHARSLRDHARDDGEPLPRRAVREEPGEARPGTVSSWGHTTSRSPAPARRDARAEADHFLRVARVTAGDVVPVLDIEETGGLSPGQLRMWARAWLERVHARTGVRAMIYSGSHFWHGFMRNTSWFARRGHPLWVAHWYVGAPDVPGGAGGAGATRSGSGRPPAGSPVSRGDVDRDWLTAPLTRGTIASLRRGSRGRRHDQRRSHRLRRISTGAASASRIPRTRSRSRQPPRRMHT